MPCFLYTWHTYGSWLPDRPQGYVHWSRGRSSTSIALAGRYRRQQKQSEVELSPQFQKDIIEELRVSATHQLCRLHFASTESTHIHVLISWRSERGWKQLRRSLRRSLSDRLNQRQHRKWFSRGGDARQVESQRHFDYLIDHYLPSHSGWKWSERRGLFR